MSKSNALVNPDRRPRPPMSNLNRGLSADCDAIEDGLIKRIKIDPSDPRYPAKRKKTLKYAQQLREAVHTGVGALANAGGAYLDISRIDQLLEPENFDKIITGLVIRAGNNGDGRNLKVTSQLLYIGRTWLNLDEDVVASLEKARTKLGKPRRGSSIRNLKAIIPFLDEKLTKRLYQLPFKLWANAKTLKDPRQTLVEQQIAIAIAIILDSWLAPGDWLPLEFSTHLLVPPSGPVVLDIRNPVTANIPLYREFRPKVSALLREYDSVLSARAGSSRRLFVSSGGEPRERMNDEIRERISAHLGHPLSPSQIVFLQAAHYLLRHPNDLATVTTMLGLTDSEGVMRRFAAIFTLIASRKKGKSLEQALKEVSRNDDHEEG